ncbi:TldD/PmbA family protein [Amycolatopsis sp. WGS_07]|uniref:TldD/PmbA family protein n=1 Tax=Amycolatopsis sp. WGS_07 TaxID=3076764 RepID=UPI00387378A7
MTSAGIDEAFLALPLSGLADAALSRARELGAAQSSFRFERVRKAHSVVHDRAVRGSVDETVTGLSVRVRRRDVTGFCAIAEATPDAAARASEEAVAVAEAASALGERTAEPVQEPVYRNKTWVSPVAVDPFSAPEAERTGTLLDWSARLLAGNPVKQVVAHLFAVKENKFYADSAGTVTTQQRIRLHPLVFVTGAAAALRTLGPPTCRGLEYLDGDGWDWDAELAALPGHLAEKERATPVEPGVHDLVLDPSNLWLTLHESVGHATELDRVLGHEASYAGTSFAAPDSLGSLRFGSSLMNVTADRTAAHGLATIGFDDEGVAAQSWPLVENGVLTGFQSDRGTARAIGAERSTGCSFAESARHVPLPRMPNVSLRPASGGPGLEDLISGVGEGIYLAGSDSFSIDTRREHFQFSAQRAYRIRDGRLAGQLSGVAYQARTTAFWRALAALGGPSSYQVFGADMCGKGQPMQTSATSHGCPAAVFAGIRVVRAG